MKRLETIQTEESWFCCPIHFTGVICRRQDFRTVPAFIYLYGYTTLFSWIKFNGNSIYEIQ